MRAVVLSALALLTFTGCATIDEAYGRPDPFEWTYFEGSPEAVIDAIGQAFSTTPAIVESARDDVDGTVLTVALRRGSAETSQILVQSTDVEAFSARAQLFPERAPLPRWLEMQVSGRM